MWFWLSLIALLCWSGSDLFSKIGCQGEDDHLAHLKMVIAVGTVMGLHAAFEIFIGGTEISWSIIWTYLPVSLLYIGSMTLGYLGLRYIELSVSSPICNSSGALVAVMTLLFVGGEDYSPLALGAIVLVCVGAIGLGVVDATEDPEIRAALLIRVTLPSHGDIIRTRHGDDLRFCLRQVKFPVFFLEVKGHGPLLFQSSGMSSTFTPRLKAYSIVERVPPRAPSFTAISRLAWSTM